MQNTKYYYINFLNFELGKTALNVPKSILSSYFTSECTPQNVI